MKNIFYLLFIFSIASLSAQVDYSKKFISKKSQFAILNYDDSLYYYDGDAVDLKIELMPEENYYLISIEGDEEEGKIAWEYVESDESVMIYQDEEGTRIDFNLQAGEMRIYLEYNKTTEFYDELWILSELEVVRKRSNGEYIPQSVRSDK